MSIVAVFDLPGLSSEQYQQIIRELEAVGLGSPDGRISHVAASKDQGTYVVDVWESEEKLAKFSETMVPIVEGTGATPAEPKIYPHRNTIMG